MNPQKIEMLIAIKNDLTSSIEAIKNPFLGEPMTPETYLKDFFANNPQYDDSQKQFDIYISFVRELYFDYIQ